MSLTGSMGVQQAGKRGKEDLPLPGRGTCVGRGTEEGKEGEFTEH